MSSSDDAIEAGLYRVPHGFTSASKPCWQRRLPILSVKHDPISITGLSKLIDPFIPFIGETVVLKSMCVMLIHLIIS